jgi:hypothetical protein
MPSQGTSVFGVELMSGRLKFGIALLLGVIAAVSLWWLYVPEHLLVRMKDIAIVTVDEDPVHVETHIANPTYYE